MYKAKISIQQNRNLIASKLMKHATPNGQKTIKKECAADNANAGKISSDARKAKKDQDQAAARQNDLKGRNLISNGTWHIKLNLKDLPKEKFEDAKLHHDFAHMKKNSALNKKILESHRAEEKKSGIPPIAHKNAKAPIMMMEIREKSLSAKNDVHEESLFRNDSDFSLGSSFHESAFGDLKEMQSGAMNEYFKSMFRQKK